MTKLNSKNTSKILEDLKAGKVPDIDNIDLSGSRMVYFLLIYKQWMNDPFPFQHIYTMIKDTATKEELQYFADCFIGDMEKHLIDWGMDFVKYFSFTSEVR